MNEGLKYQPKYLKVIDKAYETRPVHHLLINRCCDTDCVSDVEPCIMVMLNVEMDHS